MPEAVTQHCFEDITADYVFFGFEISPDDRARADRLEHHRRHKGQPHGLRRAAAGVEDRRICDV